jgi:two-component system cell cycle sensor histidine kinase/response regulator CckA
MPRKLLILALVVIGLHIYVTLTLGTSPAGSFLTNSLQVFASGLAVAMCFGARRRGRGMTRPFWLLVACGMATWSLANLGWMYYENWLRAPVPRFSIVRFLFAVQGVFYAIALFLDKEKDSPIIDTETFLDSVQIAIVFISVFFGLYYVQLLQGTPMLAGELILTWIFVAINVILTALAAIQMWAAQAQRLRSLYGGLAFFLLLYTIGSGIAESLQVKRQLQTGTWYDLGWTLPFLAGAIWAARWKESPEAPSPVPSRPRTLGNLAFTNVMLGLPPLLVLGLVAPLGREWRLIGFSLLAISIACYAARLAVTQYRHVQTAEAVQRHTRAMESALEGMAMLNAAGQFTYMNSAHARLFGYSSPSELLGKSWHVLYQPEGVARFEKDVLPQVFAEGGWRGEAHALRRDGTLFPQELSITRLSDGALVCVCRDITERLNAERARTEAEAKYRTLIEQVAAISYIAEIGVSAEWHYVSPQIGSILGYSPEEWLTSSSEWMRHVHPEDHAIVENAEAASHRGEPFQAEYRMIRKDGRVIWVSDNAVVVRDAQGHSLMEGIIVDITERKQLEVQLQQSRRMEAVGRLAGGVAHDFNNLLTIIKGYTELALNRTGIRAGLRSDIERIEDAAERAATLVRQLLAFGRKQVLQPKALDLNSIVLGLDKLLRRLMGADIEMKTLVGEDVGTVKADLGQIEQVIMNLVVNARDAMPNGGGLTIETANVDLDSTYARDHATVRPGHYVMLAVTDTGVGMDAETVSHIFEPFYTTKGGTSGTGLGLATVYGIVKQSGGYIWVYSEPDKGSSFKVYLPRVDEPAETPQTIKKQTGARKGTETILLVEDEPAVRELTRMVLAAQGYSVVEALNSEDAERLSETHGTQIHLLLTDVVMPGLSGRELARRITARHPKMKVLYMSGYTQNVIAGGGTLETGIAFLQKPFAPATLVEKVRDVLDGHSVTKS